jgi:hypothetical protein
MNFAVTFRNLAVRVLSNNEIWLAHFGRQTAPVKSLDIGKKPVMIDHISGAY